MKFFSVVRANWKLNGKTKKFLMSTQTHAITLWETVCWHTGHLEIKYNL